VHVDTAVSFRGGQEALLLLARGLRSRGHQQKIASPADSALTRQAAENGFETIPLTGPLGLRRHLQRCQIVHSHSGRAQTIAFAATMRIPLVRITTRHVAFEPRHAAVHRLKYTKTCDGIIAVSEAVRRVLVEAGVPDGKIEVIHTGIEIPSAPATQEQRAAARDKFGFRHGDFVAGHLGAFTFEKGQDIAITAAQTLRARMPQLRLILAGEGALAAAPGAIIMPGFIENREEFFAALDLFVMPSRSEGWGLAAAEALAHGVPVVASATGGLTEIVDPGATGWLVLAGDAQALAGAIVEAASDLERLREMGIRARISAPRFSSDRTAELTEAFYKRFLHASAEI